MLISGAVIKFFVLGEAGGGGRRKGGREDEKTYKIINQFGSKIDPGIAVILQ